MARLDPQFPGHVGARIWREEWSAFNRTGGTRAVNDIVQFDIFNKSGLVTADAMEGADGHWLSNVVLPASNGIGGINTVTGGGGTEQDGFGTAAWFGVVISLLRGTGAANQLMLIRAVGEVVAKHKNDDINIGTMLVAENAAVALQKLTNAMPGRRTIAVAKHDNASTAGSFICDFDGINGFGQTYLS